MPWMQAAARLEEGKQKYDNGDKMGALKLFERCLEEVRALEATGRRASCCCNNQAEAQRYRMCNRHPAWSSARRRCSTQPQSMPRSAT